jgi:hypothetical protein
MAKAAKKHTTAKKIGPAPDPILDLIAHARKRLDEYYLAIAAARKLREKVGDHNCGPAEVFGLGEYFGHGMFGNMKYHSLRQIEEGREFAERRVRKPLAENQKVLKRKRIRDEVRVKLRALIARDKFALRQIKEAADWLKSEWQRQEDRSGRLRVKSGYEKAAFNRTNAETAAILAVRALRDAKPRTLEGAAALIRFIADHHDPDGAGWVHYELDFSAALERASDVLKQKPANPAVEMLAAVRAEQGPPPGRSGGRGRRLQVTRRPDHPSSPPVRRRVFRVAGQ